MFKTTTLLFLFIIFAHGASAQLNLGVKGGLNLAGSNGHTFRSSKGVGLQAGATVSYSFNRYIAIQVEPTYNLTRLRTNRETQELDRGINRGSKPLHYLNIPALFKLKLTPGFALLAGAELNKLINEEDHHLNNGEQAFKDSYRIGHSVGIELGKVYFRYRTVTRFNNIDRNWNALIQQYQLGLKWDVQIR